MRITNRDKSNIIFWLALILLVCAVILMSSCNATKKVLKNPSAMEKVAVEYIKANPRKNDTTFLPGKIIVSDTTIYDTIPLPYPVNEKYTERHFKETIVRDTVRIESREFENALVKRIEALEVSFKNMEKEKNEWKKEAWVHRGIWIAIAIGFLAWVGMKFLRPLIKAYFKI